MTAGSLHTDDVRELYRDLILDHARNPRHFGKLDHTTHSAEGINPLCGDKLRLYLDVGADEMIRSAGDVIPGIRFLEKEGVRSSPPLNTAVNVDIGKLRALAGVREYPTRVKCATLAWHALKSALRQDTTPASTE